MLSCIISLQISSIKAFPPCCASKRDKMLEKQDRMLEKQDEAIP